MNKDIIIGIDAGTSLIKAVAFTLNGKEIGNSSVPNEYKISSNGNATQSLELTWKNCCRVIKLLKDKFSNLEKIVEKKLNPRAIIFDLGLSSFQLEDKERGFSFKSKNFLNMEMGINDNSAYDVINTLDKKHLANIIKVLGDEKDGKLIANKIDRYRKSKFIKTSKELASIIKSAKKNYSNYKKNPATKTFQALRIFVNKELTELITGLIQATKILSSNGKLVVVSFHSIEDKIVKNFFNLYSSIKKNPSRYLPIDETKVIFFKEVIKKPLIPSKQEVEENKNSRSAKLRFGTRNEELFSDSTDFENIFNNYSELERLHI